MKVTNKTRQMPQSQMLSIVSAKYLGEYKIQVFFSNGKERIIDCGKFLQRYPHPALKKYANTKHFKKFRIQNGNINWNNYEMIFPVEDLYKGKVD